MTHKAFAISGEAQVSTFRSHLAKHPRSVSSLSLCTQGADSTCTENTDFKQEHGIDNGQYSKQDTAVHNVFRTQEHETL